MAAESWRTEQTEALFDAFLHLGTRDETAGFLRDLCTLGELHDLANRWAVVRLLDKGLHYAEISELTGTSTATITRIAQWLRHGEGGYRLLLDRTRSAAKAGGAGPGQPGGPDRAAIPPDRPYPVGRER